MWGFRGNLSKNVLFSLRSRVYHYVSNIIVYLPLYWRKYTTCRLLIISNLLPRNVCLQSDDILLFVCCLPVFRLYLLCSYSCLSSIFCDQYICSFEELYLMGVHVFCEFLFYCVFSGICIYIV